MVTGDVELVALYDRTVDGVYRYAMRLTGGDRGWADELVQDTYVAALRAMRSGHPTVEPGWLVVACRHRFLDETKRDRRRRAREDRATALDPARRSGGSSDGDSVALDRLPVDQRTALVLRYIDDLPVPEVARSMGRSVHATESLLARARTALRNELGVTR